MIKPLSQQAKGQDGYRPPFTMLDDTFLLDEMSADMKGKYRPAFTAKPIAKTLIVDGVLYKDGERLEYGEQIEPLDDQLASAIHRIQREVDKATPHNMKEWQQRYEQLGCSIATPMTACDDG